MASVSWSNAALADLDSLDRTIAKRVVEKVEWLGDNFNSVVPDPLHGDLAGLYKFRIGNYRAIYAIRNGIVYIEAVKHRSEAYR